MVIGYLRERGDEEMRMVSVDRLDPWMETLVGLYREAYQGLEEYADTSVEDIEKYLRWLHNRTPDSFFILLDDDEVLGFVVADYCWQEKGEPVGEIHEIVVFQKARERGVGKLLMEKAIGLFKEKGLSKAGLWVGRTNTHAYDFYRHLGFRETGRVGIWIRMEKAL